MIKLIALLLLIAPAAQAEMKTLTFQKDLLPRDARAWEYSRASTLVTNSEVVFKLRDEPNVVAGQIQLTGVVTNSSPERKTIYLVGDKDVLKIELESNDQVRLRAPQKKNTAMYALEIPAKTEVLVTGSVPLDRYIYTGSPNVKINWAFQFWTTPRPKGSFNFKLPTATEAQVAPLKIEFQKFTSQDDSKLTARIRNVSSEPQMFCRSSQVNFDWDLKHVDDKPVENAERLSVDYTQRPMTKEDCAVIKPNETYEAETANIRKDGATFSFQSTRVTWKNLKPGQYKVWFQALNSAVDADSKLIDDILAHSAAVKPTKANQQISTTESVAIP